ncbi:type II secretion system protein GspI [Lampropedia puyangensis]|uniref:Type II secretion system protein I n=1 Tax=Lampropedia puyangensis TaxID=1330072 RepID=A0A4S8FAG6_9BURK|nr:type II secretion system minor pseudopilin GspI [Lampropedia puyangensis]THU04563.1 type II secretion system protein GspI [Lampropedia puyangensis]
MPPLSPPTTQPAPHLQRGFTLIEVLVALAIVAVALAAGSRAAGALIHNADRRSDVMLAQWCAENALIQARMLMQLPPIGTTPVSCEQAGRHFQVEVVTSGTPNPSLRRVDARVSTDQYFVLSLSTMVGRF